MKLAKFSTWIWNKKLIKS